MHKSLDFAHYVQLRVSWTPRTSCSLQKTPLSQSTKVSLYSVVSMERQAN